ncbi:MAG: L-2-amino-thiazoline-4-carboxylic acid hydrolase [Oscillospiraceae bacterium]|nr:L-2-amino-thiazoline-4-carboxylic acid hydrolase [Oscillospiraceae bacterium]
MVTDKTIENYTKIYRKALTDRHFSEIETEIDAYRKRLAEMYASEDFKKFCNYPSTNTVHVYAVIAMCLGLKRYDLSDREIIDTINSGFSVRKNFFRRLLRFIDRLPIAYHIAEKWNISDHDKRVMDGSLTYDYFNVTDGKIEYCISKCVYIEMFELYGIRSLCKIFCMTDTSSYENLPKHVEFIRYSDLSDGSCCHDVILAKQN